jgi:hypothetical protein
MLELVCYLAALILWLIAAANAVGRVNLVAAGLAVAIVPTLWHAITTVS